MSTPLVLVAASGLARETVECLRRSRREVLGVLDDDRQRWGTTLDVGVEVLGGIETVERYPQAEVVLCPGRGAARANLEGRLRERGVTRFATVVDPSVHVPRSCEIGEGSIILAGCVLTASVQVGRHVVCMPKVTLTHDDVLEDFCTLASDVRLGGGVRVGARAYLGMGAGVRENLTVGRDAVLGMGSALLTDLPVGQTWGGVPARPIG